MLNILSRLALLFVITLMPGFASADQYVQMQNRWKPDQWIHVEHGPVQVGQVQQGWWSKDWVIEPVGDGQHVRFKNRWKNTYLHVEYGPLMAGNIQPGWWSAMWILEDGPYGTNFHRLRNRWTGVYMHIEFGQLMAGQIQPGWWSAMWTLHGM